MVRRAAFSVPAVKLFLQTAGKSELAWRQQARSDRCSSSMRIDHINFFV